MAQIARFMIQLDPATIKIGESGDLTITVKNLEGLPVDLSIYTGLKLRITDYPARTITVELLCSTSEEDAVNGICACIVEDDTFEDVIGTCVAELVLSQVEQRLGYDGKSSDFTPEATVTGGTSEASALVVNDVETGAPAYALKIAYDSLAGGHFEPLDVVLGEETEGVIPEVIVGKVVELTETTGYLLCTIITEPGMADGMNIVCGAVNATITGDPTEDLPAGRLVVDDVEGTFEVDENITDDGEIPGEAIVATELEEVTVANMTSLTAYFFVERAITPAAP